MYPLPHLHLWEVGANLGDCTLWAAAILSNGTGRQEGIQVNAVGFEPVPEPAKMFRQTADSLMASYDVGNGVVRAGLRPEIHVRRLSLGDHIGTRQISVPRSSVAEATFHNCQNATGGSCQEVPLGDEHSRGALYARVRTSIYIYIYS